MSADSGTTVEQIPDDAQVSRAYFEAPGEPALAPETYFAFMYDRTRDERAESVYWRKYAPRIEDVHERGCRLEKKWSYLEPEARPSLRYVGARTAVVGHIRRIKTQRGHSFRVIHYPQDGDVAHAHIAVERAGGKVKNLNPNDRLELTALLVRELLGYQPHTCGG